MSAHSGKGYIEWRAKRIQKLEKLFTPEYFKDKKILEVGAGSGLIGKYFREVLGSDVTFTDGRPPLVELIKTNNPNSKVYLIDHDKPWIIPEEFDFIIHWGLLYHLNNWQADLEVCFSHLKSGGVMSLESEVIDSDTIDDIKVDENAWHDDQSLNSKGSRPSPVCVEEQIKKLGLEFKRYDDADLDTQSHRYSWGDSNSKVIRGGYRRFWIMTKSC